MKITTERRSVYAPSVQCRDFYLYQKADDLLRMITALAAQTAMTTTHIYFRRLGLSDFPLYSVTAEELHKGIYDFFVLTIWNDDHFVRTVLNAADSHREETRDRTWQWYFKLPKEEGAKVNDTEFDAKVKQVRLEYRDWYLKGEYKTIDMRAVIETENAENVGS